MSLEKAVAEKQEPLSEDWASARFDELTHRIDTVELFNGGECLPKECEYEFHTRLKMLERDIEGQEAGNGLNYEFEKLEKRVRDLEEYILITIGEKK